MRRLLLDTHALLWWLDGDNRLPEACREVIDDETVAVYVSAASAWEISTKFRIGKLPGAAEVANNIAACIESQGFEPLPISIRHAQRAGLLPGPHRDPFDRMLAAQAQAEELPIASRDVVFNGYGVRRLWDGVS